MSDDPHAVALLARLRTVPQTVYDGRVPDPIPAPPYILARVTVETLGQKDVGGDSNVVTSRLWCYCAGANAEAARMVLVDVNGVLLNHRPTVTGRSCGLIRHEETREADTDEQMGRTVVTLLAIYTLTTYPG